MNDPTSDKPEEGFNKKWDAVSNHTSTTTVNHIESSQVILETLKTKRRTETAQWLSGLEKEIAASNTANPSTTRNNLPSLSANPMTTSSTQLAVDTTMIGEAIQWLDKMFVQFELYAAQFNLGRRGTNLVVSCTRPIKRTNNTGGLYSEAADDCLSYAGHIATQFWTLVVRGCATKVEVFILPAELLIAFSVSSSDESGYEPLLVLESAWRGKEVIWHAQNTVITTDQIPALAKELFGDLIKVASGQMTEAEVMANPIQTISSNDNPAIPPALPSNPKPSSTPLIEELVNPGSVTITPASSTKTTPTAPIPNTSAIVSFSSLESIKAANRLIASIDKDIHALMESGKQALEVDDTAGFENVKGLTTKLEALKNAISTTLSNIPQSDSK